MNSSLKTTLQHNGADGDFLLFVIGTSSFIPHSGFLIRHFN